MSAPSLYTFIDKDRLHEMLDAFHSCLDSPVQVIDTNGEILESCGETTPFCQIFKNISLPMSPASSSISKPADVPLTWEKPIFSPATPI